MSLAERLIIAVSIVCVIGCIVWMVVTSQRQREAMPATPSTPVAAPPVAPAAPPSLAPSYLELQVGQVGVLDTGTGQTDVAVSPEALVGMADAAKARSLPRLRRFFARGQAFTVPDGTGAKLLIGGMQINEVQLTDGTYAGRKGWIAAEWIRRADTLPQNERDQD